MVEKKITPSSPPPETLPRGHKTLGECGTVSRDDFPSLFYQTQPLFILRMR